MWYGTAMKLLAYSLLGAALAGCVQDPQDTDDEGGGGKADGSGAVALDHDTYRDLGTITNGQLKGLTIHGEFTGNSTRGGAVGFVLSQPSDVVVSAGYGNMGGPFIARADGTRVDQRAADPPNSYFCFMTAQSLPAGRYWIALANPTRYDFLARVTYDARPASSSSLPIIPAEGSYQITAYASSGSTYPPTAVSINFSVRHSDTCIFTSSASVTPLDCYIIDFAGGWLTDRIRVAGPVTLVATQWETAANVNATIYGSSSPYSAAARVSASLSRSKLSSLSVSYVDPKWGDSHNLTLTYHRI